MTFTTRSVHETCATALLIATRGVYAVLAVIEAQPATSSIPISKVVEQQGAGVSLLDEFAFSPSGIDFFALLQFLHIGACLYEAALGQCIHAADSLIQRAARDLGVVVGPTPAVFRNIASTCIMAKSADIS